MSPTLDAFLRSWPFDPWLLAALAATGLVYWRGWRALRARDPRRWHGGHLAAMCGGLAAIYVALASPIEPFAALLLLVHMVQHLLLMFVVPNRLTGGSDTDVRYSLDVWVRSHDTSWKVFYYPIASTRRFKVPTLISAAGQPYLKATLPDVGGELDGYLMAVRKKDGKLQRAFATVSQGGAGPGHAVPLTADTGAFWFFRETNLELAVKALDGRSANGFWWIFYGSLSNVPFTLTVRNTETGNERTYVNPPRTPFAPIQDTSAFATCP